LHPSEHLIHQVIGTRTSQALEQALDRRRVAIDSVEGAVVIQTLCVRQDAFEFGFVLLAQTVPAGRESAARSRGQGATPAG
jgi:hypothetical protein